MTQSIKPNIKKVFVASDDSTCATLDAWKNKEVELRLLKAAITEVEVPPAVRVVIAQFIVKESDAFVAILRVKERAKRTVKPRVTGNGTAASRKRGNRPTTTTPATSTTA